jgi:hypothetical protein
MDSVRHGVPIMNQQSSQTFRESLGRFPAVLILGTQSVALTAAVQCAELLNMLFQIQRLLSSLLYLFSYYEF